MSINPNSLEIKKGLSITEHPPLSTTPLLLSFSLPLKENKQKVRKYIWRRTRQRGGRRSKRSTAKGIHKKYLLQFLGRFQNFKITHYRIDILQIFHGFIPFNFTWNELSIVTLLNSGWSNATRERQAEREISSHGKRK